jgi:hypothetical protein
LVQIPTVSQEIIYIAIAHGEPEMDPGGLSDNIGIETVSLLGNVSHQEILTEQLRRNEVNVTVPGTGCAGTYWK